MAEKKKIMLMTPMLHQGGFERICALTAQLLKETCEVHLVVFTKQDMFYDVSGVHLIDLELPAVSGTLGKVCNIFRRVRKLKKIKKKLGIQISYSFGQSANIVNVLSKCRDVTWAGIRGYGSITEKREMQLICRYADRIISCTKVMEHDIAALYHVKNSAVLYNPCNLDEIKRLSENTIDSCFEDFLSQQGKTVVSVGREDDYKCFWSLLKIVALAKKQLPDLKLMIIGDGEYTEYKKLAQELGIAQDVLFTGVQKNPFALLARADVYAMTSSNEGFPNAMLEAMYCGLPCISTNCKTGPAEILNEDYLACTKQDKLYHADYGILIPVSRSGKNMDAGSITQEEEIFANELVALLENEEFHAKYGELGKKRAQQFGMETYVDAISALMGKDCS